MLPNLGDELLNIFLGKGSSLISDNVMPAFTPPIFPSGLPSKAKGTPIGHDPLSSLLVKSAAPFLPSSIGPGTNLLPAKSLLAPATKPPASRRGQLICLIGKPGIGKSSWAAQWPDPEIITEEKDQGMMDLAHEGLLPVQPNCIYVSGSYGAYKANLEMSLSSTCKTIICEGLRGIQALCLEHCSKVDHDGDYSNRSFLNYQAGPIQAAEKYFQDLINLMMKAQTLGKHVILVGHSKSVAQDNKTGDDWMAETLEANPRFSAIVGAAFSNIFHIVDAVPVEKRAGKNKASSDTSRWMYVNVNPFYFAKNRMGLVGEIEFPSSPREAYLSYCKAAKRDPRTGYKL